MVKKTCWMGVFCVFIVVLCLSVKWIFFRAQTTQQILPPCYGYFENLYFDAARTTFFTLGKKADLSKAIFTHEKRKCSWRNFAFMPFKLCSKAFDPISGLTAIAFERKSTPLHSRHYFHFLEHVIGLWNFGGESKREDVKLFLFAGNGEMEPPENWKGANEITLHLVKALFPQAQIKLWGDFVNESQKGVRFEKVITSDRCMEYLKKEPYYTERMLGEYYRYLTPASLDRMALAVHTYCGVNRIKNDKLIVTYVPRPEPRCLTPIIEKQLLEKIEQLPNVELRVVDFACLNFKDQVNAVANTDVLLGVHGNGLSHTLFLPKGSTLIELFPKDCLRVEYRIFAQIRELNYFGMISGRGWIDDETAETLGVFGEHQAVVNDIDVDSIVSVIHNCLKSTI